MPKGGARTRSGPPPDPNALRRDRKSDGEWTSLPAEGREGDLPEWPLADQSGREVVLWAAEWRRPQAVMWERNGQQLEVALYVRQVVDAEARGATTASRTLVRQMMDSLGISSPGMRSLRWRITSDEVAERRGQSPRVSARDRLKAVSGGEG